VHEDFARAEGAALSLGVYAEQIASVRAWSVESPRLRALLAGLEHEGVSSDERLHRLGKLVDFAESRRNPVHQAASLLLLLDFHVHHALERWKAASGQRLRGWLAALGEIEALAALASLSHDHPDWCFPTPAARVQLDARGLGHPLLRPAAAVRNDVQVGPAGTFLLVTGSNMSGKSTLLRAIALNCVLGGAGAPACARELVLPDVRLHTSIRVQDSLEQGVSLFMAELLALARIVRAARAAAEQGGTVLYLLDEVLQGTNSGDRRIAARTVLRHLLDAGAIGAATTHDLSLASAPDLEARAQVVHFSETALPDPGGPRLSFDYRLQPGLATSRNALLLLEMVGLGPVEEPAPSE
jgi:DNA mismatch repair ATPase MutS